MTEISTILQPTGVPIEHLVYLGKKTTYIVYTIYNSNGAAFAENKEIATNYYVQVDIYTKDSYESLANQVRSLMTAAGYYRTDEKEYYESETQLKHKIFDFQYEESSQN